MISSTLGAGQAKPRLAFALIFGTIALYFLILFIIQRSELAKIQEATAADPVAPGEIINPATLDDGSLYAAMAINPIDATALKARRAMWKPAWRSLHLGMLITALIFLSVPPIYLFDTWVPFLIGTPIIVLCAIYGAIRAIAPGGYVDQGFDRADVAMAPLGLAIAERPEIRMRSRGPFQPGFSARLDGALVMTGTRHGRQVTITRPPLEGIKPVSQTLVAASAPEFTMKSRDGRIKAAEGAPDAVVAALKAVPASTRWNGVTGSGSAAGISFERKGDTGDDWMLDLWLAERLADALGA